MAKKVLKFGGTSVGTIERIQHVANIVHKEHKAGNQIIVVISAMSGKTNELINFSKDISNEFSKRELDVLLSSGEQATCALLAGALIELNIKSKSWLSWQIPILTEGEHTNARIINMNIEKINDYLNDKGVAVIPGFQGISKMGDMTTIGRGGSDATAVAAAKIFEADSCEIYTDVDGVYSTDPNKIPVAKKIDKISYDEMLELSSLGAKVMQPSAVQTAMMYSIPLEVRSTFTDRQGTKIFEQENIQQDFKIFCKKINYEEKVTLEIVNKNQIYPEKTVLTELSKKNLKLFFKEDFIIYNYLLKIKDFINNPNN